MSLASFRGALLAMHAAVCALVVRASLRTGSVPLAVRAASSAGSLCRTRASVDECAVAATRATAHFSHTTCLYRALTDMDQDQRLNPEEINLTPQAFADADLDGDGQLSGAEFVQARFMQFEAIDANGDQEITPEEFRTFMTQYHL